MTPQNDHGKKHLYTFVTAAYHKIQDNLGRIPAQCIVKFPSSLACFFFRGEGDGGVGVGDAGS